MELISSTRRFSKGSPVYPIQMKKRWNMLRNKQYKSIFYRFFKELETIWNKQICRCLKKYFKKLSWQGETWAEFSTLEVVLHTLALQSSAAAKLRVANSAQTTSTFPPVRFRAPRFHEFSRMKVFNDPSLLRALKRNSQTAIPHSINCTRYWLLSSRTPMIHNI